MVIMTDLPTLSSVVFTYVLQPLLSRFLLSDFSLTFFFFLPVFPALPVCTGRSSRSPAVAEEAALPCGAKWS